MSELWIPQPNKHPDVTNIYDMMLVYQEHLDDVEDQYSKILFAKDALKALINSLRMLEDEELQVTVTTGLAILDNTEKPGAGAIMTDIGMHGVIEDIHCVQVNERFPWAVSLGIDVVSVFSLDDPDETDYVMTNAKAPIGSVRYIETIAS